MCACFGRLQAHSSLVRDYRFSCKRKKKIHYVLEQLENYMGLKWKHGVVMEMTLSAQL